MTFKCGHSAPEPSNMGRGAARQRRLSTYFSRNCYECSVEYLTKLHNSFTNTPVVSLEERLRKLDLSYTKESR